MTLFKYRQFSYDIIIWAVRGYCKYGISYRELEEMLCERGVNVDHSTIYRWVQRYAPEIEKRLRWYWKPKMGLNWQVDETYIKVKGKWVYLYRAIDKKAHTVDFYLSPRRNAKSAKRFWVRCERTQVLVVALHHQYRQGRFLWGRHHGIKERRSMP